MAEIHNLQAKTKLLHAQSLLLRLGESEAAKALQKVVDRLGGDSPAHALADDLPAGWGARRMQVLGDGPEVEGLQAFANRVDAFPLTPESVSSASQSVPLTLAQRLLALVRCGWSSFGRRSP